MGYLTEITNKLKVDPNNIIKISKGAPVQKFYSRRKSKSNNWRVAKTTFRPD